MKKKILSIFSAFLCAAMCFSGCSLGSFIENGGNGNSSNNGSSSTPVEGENPPADDEQQEELKLHYRVSVIYKNAPYTPSKTDEINVVWRNDFEIKRVELGSDGTADAGKLEGDYSVYLEGLPEKYFYDPNGYTATEDERFVSILVTDIQNPDNITRADGKGLYSNEGCYSVSKDGTYRATIDGNPLKIHPATGSDIIYENGAKIYQYTPTAEGWYSITSKVNVYDDDLNPLIDVYNGTSAYKWFNRTIDGGGVTLAGGYTKNFCYEVKISKAETGNAFTFAVYAASKYDKFPVSVDFTIKYEGEYKSSYENIRVVTPQEKLIKAENPKINESFVWANLGTNVFDMSNYRYNDATRRYHFYNMDLYGDNQLGYGAGMGPYLLCAITPKIPCYPKTSLFEADKVLNPGTGAVSNYLQLYNIWFEDEQTYGTLDYTDFIKTGYANYCNNAGYCYVTKELMEFLRLYADNHALYNDGNPDTGTPESLGYYAEEDALWLFACGFYFAGGVNGLKEALKQ